MLDFGLVKLLGDTTFDRLTAAGAISGTPAYMSPEQAAGQPPDERSDLFALGVVLHEAVTGANPFTCDDMLEAMRRVRQMDPPLDTEELQALPESVHSLIQSCLRKDPSARPNSAADALKLIADGTNAVEQPRHRERKQTRIVLSLSIVVIMCLAMVISFWPRRDGGLNLSHTTPRGSEIMSDNLSAEQPINDEKLPAEKQTASHDTASTIDPAPVAEHVGEETVARIDRAIRQNTATDSTELWLDVSPWAHVYYNGRRLGTTPMRYSVRLPAGRQTFSFHNPAFPEIHLTMDLAQGHDSIRVNLAEHVAMLEIEVSPWGNVYLDGEPVGSSPLAHPLFFRPGLHNVRVSHPTLRAVEKSFEAQAGDTIMVIANLDRTELAMRRTRETTE
ncbi:PEGA domain-containing protein [bacterium]|nr:PEGA domain-containing protein [bacterium]